MSGILKKASINGSRLALSGLTAMAVLSIFCFFYSYQVSVKNPGRSTDYNFEPNWPLVNMREGFARNYADKNGFVNLEADSQIDILLMGGSNMEAAQVSVSNNTASLLNEKLDFLHTYNISISEHYFYRCIYHLESALEQFQPKSYVLICVDQYQNQTEEMQDAFNGTLSQIAVSDSTPAHFIKKYIPVVRELRSMFAQWMTAEERSAGSDAAFSTEGEWLEYGEALGQLAGYAASLANAADVKMIWFYLPTVGIKKDGSYSALSPEESRYIELLRQTCESHGIYFLDMSSAFGQLYAEEHVPARGFINGGVGTGHINQYGHTAVAEELSELIMELWQER